MVIPCKASATLINNDDATSMNIRQHNDQLYLLINASNNGDLLPLKQLLKDGVPVNEVYDNKCTALAIAVQNGHLQVAEELLNWNADINFELDGQQLLWLASFYKNAELVKLLIKYNAPLNKIQSRNGSTPLFVAIYNNDYHTAKVLIDAHSDVNITHIFSGHSPLHQAAIMGHYVMVKELIKAGAVIDSLDIRGETPLFGAIEGRSIQIISALLSFGANINHISPVGRTALSKANQFFPEIDVLIRKENKNLYDISQTRIINQVIVYYESTNKQFPDIYHIDDLKEMEKGLCKGLGLYLTIIDGKERKRFISQLKLVDAWDGNIEIISKELKEIFEIKLATIIWLHAGIDLTPELTRIYANFKFDTCKLINFILDTEDDLYEQVFSIGFVFKKREIKEVLMNVLRDNIKIMLYANNHVISIKKVSENLFVYDSNSSIGELTAKSIDELIEKIFIMFEYYEYKPQIGLHIEGISKIKFHLKDKFNKIQANIINKLLTNRKKKNEIDIQDSITSLTALAYAVQAKDFKLVKALVECGAIINYVGVYATPLAIAVQIGDVKIVNYLLTHGADANAKFTNKNGHKIYALSIGISFGFNGVVCLLLKHGADTNIEINKEHSALSFAVMKRNLKIIKNLIQHGANIEGKTNPKKFTPLFTAVGIGSVKLVKLLLQNGANYNYPCQQKGKTYTTPLSMAIHCNKLKILKLFVANGADLNTPIFNDVLPIHLATNKEMISYIQEEVKKTIYKGSLLSIGYQKNNLFQLPLDKKDKEIITNKQSNLTPKKRTLN